MASLHSFRARWFLCVLLLGAAACGRQVVRTLTAPSAVETLDANAPLLKAHTAKGGVYVLSAWSIDSIAGILQGTGSVLDARRVVQQTGEITVPMDEIVLFETNVVERSGPAQALTIFSGITAAVAGICIASPKTCFGSCPTFYAPDRTGEFQLQAEGFSASIAPGLEATDVDMLLQSVAEGGQEFPIRVTNEALETHVIRSADLLSMPLDGGDVYMTSDGDFLRTGDAVPPDRCLAQEGDCLVKVATADGVERWSLADSADLATQETIELVFSEPPSGDLGLVLVSRQSLMTTFLIYQALAYLGTDAGRLLARLGSGDLDARTSVSGVGERLGRVEVFREMSDGSWRKAGAVGETGPIATDTRMVPLGRTQGGALRLQLRLTQGMWRLDQAALVTVGEQVRPRRLSPSGVYRGGKRDEGALGALLDPERTLVTLPGDELEIRYSLPEGLGPQRVFLEARGYYLEWMRQEWMSEQDAAKALQLLVDPGDALKALAPAYKAVESEIEHLFWSSRYGRH